MLTHVVLVRFGVGRMDILVFFLINFMAIISSVSVSDNPVYTICTNSSGLSFQVLSFCSTQISNPVGKCSTTITQPSTCATFFQNTSGFYLERYFTSDWVGTFQSNFFAFDPFESPFSAMTITDSVHSGSEQQPCQLIANSPNLVYVCVTGLAQLVNVTFH